MRQPVAGERFKLALPLRLDERVDFPLPQPARVPRVVLQLPQPLHVNLVQLLAGQLVALNIRRPDPRPLRVGRRQLPEMRRVS